MAALGPGDLGQVFQCLKGALDQSPAVQRQGEAALQALEARPGFCSCLAEIIASPDADHSTRWLAAVHFKNSVTKHWRSRLPGALGEEEKGHLRRKLLDLVGEGDSQIAVQLAVVVAKLARVDYPAAWPSLFIDLQAAAAAASQAAAAAAAEDPGQQQADASVAAARARAALVGRRVPLVLHHVLKELSSKRLASDQRNFEEATAQLLPGVWAQWAADTQAIGAALPGALAGTPPQALLLALERWLLQLKALRRLLLFGFPSDARTLEPAAAAAQAAPAFLEALRAFAAARAPGAAPPAAPSPQRSQLSAMADRGVLKLLKTLRQLAGAHPWAVLRCGAVASCLDFCVTLLMGGGGGAEVRPGGLAAEALAVQALLMVHAVQRCPSYRGQAAALTLNVAARGQLDRLKSMSAEAQAALRAFWGGGRLQALVTALVTRFFPLKDKELAEWSDSGESFHHEVVNGAWEESVRGCAQNTFLVLFESDREAVAPVVVELLRSAGERCPPGAAGSGALPGPSVHGVPEAVLAKEAAYTAAAVGAYELHDHLDFTAWLHSALLPEMCDPAPAAKPLRRRAVAVVSHWTSRLRAEDRPPVYRALLGALGDGDEAVQLAGVVSMQALVDDWDFQEGPFLEFVGPCFSALAALLAAAGELDSQLLAFNLLSTIIDRLADGVRPYAPGLLGLLPGVWAAAEGQSLLRVQVLVALQRLANALGADSPATYPLVLPVLRLVTDPAQPDALNLLEDGLQLWLVALRNAPAPEPGLLALFPNLAATMAASTEHISVGMRICTSCVLLGGAEFLRHYGGSLVSVLVGFIGNVKDRGMLALFPAMTAVVQCFPTEGPQLLGPALARLLGVMLSGRESGVVVAAALGVYARVLLQGGLPLFLALLGAAAGGVELPADAPQAADPGQRVLLSLLDLWLEKFDSIGQAGARKLSALALCTLLPAPVPALLERLDALAAHVTAVWFEVEGSDLAPGSSAARGYDFWAAAPRDDDPHAAVSSEEAEGESSRRRALHEADPVNVLRLSAYCGRQLEAAAAAHGGALSAALNALDPTLGGQLKAMLESG